MVYHSTAYRKVIHFVRSGTSGKAQSIVSTLLGSDYQVCISWTLCDWSTHRSGTDHSRPHGEPGPRVTRSRGGQCMLPWLEINSFSRQESPDRPWTNRF